MIYGLYASASGVTVSLHRQDVIANNLANVETAGFKRDLATFRQRLTAAEESAGRASWGDPRLRSMPGGVFLSPTATDQSAGTYSATGNPLDVAIEGEGFLTVRHARRGSPVRLTRDGRLAVRDGFLVLSSTGDRVLGADSQPIAADPTAPVQIAADGTVSQSGRTVGTIAVVTPADPRRLTKLASGLFNPANAGPLRAVTSAVRSGALEGSNVDPSTELVEMLETQRQLEANANMIRLQDQTLGRLVNDVGKIA